MKMFAKIILALSALALPWAAFTAEPRAGRAAEPPKAKLTVPDNVRVALALAVAAEPPRVRPARRGCPCGCSCGGACQCASPGQCGEPDCTCGAAKRPARSSFSAAYHRAIAEGRPLLIWVAEVCPPCEVKMSGYVHAHVQQYDGYSGLVTEPCVVVGRPDGMGGLVRVGTLPGIPTPEQVRAILAPRLVPIAQPSYRPAFRPVFCGRGG